MGYTTEFEGSIVIVPRLPDAFVERWNVMAGRRNNTYADGSELSFDGVLHRSLENRWVKRNHMYNPMQYAPSCWYGWTLKNKPKVDETILEWDGGEKFSGYREWCQYTIECIAHLFPELSVTFRGSITWQGESEEDRGTITVNGPPQVYWSGPPSVAESASLIVYSSPHHTPSQLYVTILMPNVDPQAMRCRIEPTMSPDDAVNEPFAQLIGVRGNRKSDSMKRRNIQHCTPSSCCLYGHQLKSSTSASASVASKKGNTCLTIEPYPVTTCHFEATFLLPPLCDLVLSYVGTAYPCSGCANHFNAPAAAWIRYYSPRGNGTEILGRYCSISCLQQNAVVDVTDQHITLFHDRSTEIPQGMCHSSTHKQHPIDLRNDLVRQYFSPTASAEFLSVFRLVEASD